MAREITQTNCFVLKSDVSSISIILILSTSMCLISGTLSQDQPASSEVTAIAVTEKEIAGQHHGSDEPVRSSRTDQVFRTSGGSKGGGGGGGQGGRCPPPG